MKYRLIWMITVGLLVFGLLPAAAQDADAAFAAFNCLDLSEADCALVTEAMENIATIESFHHEFRLSQSISNASNLVQGFDRVASVEGSGTFFINRELLSKQDPFSGFSMSADVSGELADDEGEQSGEASVIIADGNLYVQDADSGDWRGASLADVTQNPELMSLPVMGMSIPFGDVMQNGAGALDGDLSLPLLDGFDVTALAAIPGFIRQERLPDETVDAQIMAVFRHTADIGVLLSSEEWQDAFAELSAMMSETEDAVAQQMAMMLPILLENTTGTATFTRWIGGDDHLPHRFELDVRAAIDLGIRSGTGTPVPPIEVTFSAALSLSEINNADAPTSPAGALIVASDELLAQP